jgi:feruloyl esterase
MMKAHVVFVMILLAAYPVSATTCESMAKLALHDTTITLAKSVAAGEFAPTKPFPFPAPGYKNLPAFCRVAAEIKPTKDSNIKFEVWMPLTGWNGKFQAIGNGGWSGEIWYPFMGPALGGGYATASTDTGHEGDPGDASFAMGHPEKMIDFGYRAVHEMTVKAKAIIAAFYGNEPRLSYWNGCSSGGRQGLKEAQRFPLDYDGIVAGAPANNWTPLMAGGVWNAQAEGKNPESFIPATKYPLLHRAAVDACDSLDGLKDGLIGNPASCHFDPQVLQCKDGDGPACLTRPQVEAARKIYAGAMNPRTGSRIFPGSEPGSELEWPFYASGEPPIVASYFKYLVFKNPKWDFRTLNFDSDIALADKIDEGTISATDANLKPFVQHGGKLILYHGWSDGLIAPQNTINYYNSVVAAMGGPEKVQNSIRLFMAPGMGHCFRGDGPSNFDAVTALDQWVGKGTAPDRIVASQVKSGAVDRTRPLCAYPQVAEYRGSGSIDDAANFVCKADQH